MNGMSGALSTKIKAALAVSLDKPLQYAADRVVSMNPEFYGY